LRNLEKLRIVGGDDMSPSINPKESLLLDKEAAPELGDVVLFENRFGKKIAHRLLHRFGGYCFTKGDNCPRFDFPFPEDKLLGVVVGKTRSAEKKLLAGILLAVFLPQFIIHSRLFGLKNKKFFLLLSMASRHYPHIEVKKDG
jgi:hypothetical protein